MMWTYAHVQKSRVCRVLILTNMDHKFLLYGKKCGQWNCILCYFISNLLSLPPLQNPILAWTKQQALASPPYNNELGNCLLKGSLHMSLWWLCEILFQNMKWLVTRVHSRIPNSKVAWLDYNVNWNIIISPAQCLCLWHNSTEETF